MRPAGVDWDAAPNTRRTNERRRRERTSAPLQDWTLPGCGRLGRERDLIVEPAFLACRLHEEFRVRRNLFDRGDVHLAGTQACRTLLVPDEITMSLARGAEVQRLGILIAHVPHHFAVLTEEQTAVRIQHDALRLE